ncbi:MAG: hypothetical protein JHC34_01030 [Acidobacteria bacterium]|jgi:hypothetical protein|nr:hypothetical protein [Acidobacteriota bacterium]
MMDFARLLESLPPELPPVALLLEPPTACGLRAARSRGGISILSKAEQPFAPISENLELESASLEALATKLLAPLGQPQRASIILGDSLVRMQVLSLSDFPSKEEERQQVLKWHVKKVLNWEPGDLRIRYHVFERSGQTATLWLTMGSENLIRALEGAFAKQGCHIGYIGGVTPELYGLASRKEALPNDGAALLINRTPGAVSFLFTERGLPQFFRCKELWDSDGDDAEMVAQEIRLTLAYQRERLGGAPLRVAFTRCSPPSLALPLEGAVGDNTEVVALRERLPSAVEAERTEMTLPLFGVLEE